MASSHARGIRHRTRGYARRNVRSRRTLPVIAVAAVLALTLSMGQAHAGSKPARSRAKLLTFVNHYRVDHGLRKLRENRDVDRIAQHHSSRMASARKLFHSSGMWTKLRSHHPSCWGENIGMGPSVWRVFKAWTRSKEHRANMLDRHYRRTGMGIVLSHGYYWVTMIYYG
jgi:uncharacterized protein YkwD